MMEDFYKIVFDISYYYVFAVFILRYVWNVTLHPTSFMLLVAVAFLSQLVKRLRGGEILQKGVVLLFPAIIFLLETEVSERIVFLIPWVYFVIVTVLRAYYTDYSDFRKLFRILLWPFLILFILFIDHPEKGYPAANAAIPYLIFFLTTGVMLQQTLRYHLKSEDKSSFERFQLKQTLGFFCICILISVGNLLERMLQLLYQGLIKPFIKQMILLIYWIMQRILLLFHYEIPVEDKKPIKEYFEKVEEAGTMLRRDSLAEMMQEVQKSQKVLDYRLLVFWVCIVAAVFVFVVLIGKKRKPQKRVIMVDEREDLPEEEKPQERLKKHSAHPNDVIRYYYREFMKKTNSGNRKLNRADTTEKIKTKSVAQYPNKAEVADEITELYRKVRYTEQEMSKKDAEQMKKFVEKMK